MLWILWENNVLWMSWNCWKAMVLVKHHRPILWNKYLLTKNIWYSKIIFSWTYHMLSLKLSFRIAKDCINLNIFTLALFTVCQRTHCTALTTQCFYLRKNKGASVLLLTMHKRVAMTFCKSQRLNAGNQYH